MNDIVRHNNTADHGKAALPTIMVRRPFHYHVITTNSHQSLCAVRKSADWDHLEIHI